MKVKLTKEYWILSDPQKEYFLIVDEDYSDWTQQIHEAEKFPSEHGAIHFNKTRIYDLVEQNEVYPIKVVQTFEY